MWLILIPIAVELLIVFAPEAEDLEEDPDQPEDTEEELSPAIAAPQRVRYQEGDQLIWDEDLVEDEVGNRHLRYFDPAGELWDENLDDPDRPPKIIGTKGTELGAYYHDKQGNRH